MNKKLLAAAVGSAIAAPMTAQAIDFKVSGHVNRMIRFADNGAGSDIQQTDNTASRSRVRFTGSQEIGSGITAGVRVEFGVASNLSGQTAPKGDDTDDEPGRGGSLRHSALFFSGNFGKVTMGHTSTASDGTGFADNSGTFLGAERSRGEHCSSCLWVFETAGNPGVGATAGTPATADLVTGVVTPAVAASAGVTLGDGYDSFDGGRRDTLRYDSPSLGGIATVAAAVGNNEFWDLGVFVDTALAGGQFSANFGYSSDGNASGGDKEDQFTISASYLASQGTNLTVGYGTDDPRGSNDFGDNFGYYVKVGHKWGNNAASIDYGHNTFSDIGGATGVDLETDSIGLAFVHTLPKAGVEAYTGYHYHWADLDGAASIEDIHTFVVGARVKFQ